MIAVHVMFLIQAHSKVYTCYLCTQSLYCVVTFAVFRTAVLSQTCRRQSCLLFITSMSWSSFHAVLLSQLQVSTTAVMNCSCHLFTDLS